MKQKQFVCPHSVVTAHGSSAETDEISWCERG